MNTMSPAQTTASERFVILRSTLSTQSPVPRPERLIRLLGNIAPGWELVYPLTIALEQDEDGSYIVSDDLFAVYGDGGTDIEALRDYTVALIDYYQLLAAHVTKDDPSAQAQLRHLQLYLRPLGQ